MLRSQEWQSRLRDVLLTRIGHSRRFAAEMRQNGGAYLLWYSFETGFDSRRISHSWRLVVVKINEDPGRAIITRQAWLVAMAQGSMRREILLTDATPTPNESPLVAIVDDEDTWRARLSVGLDRWFAEQPPGRSWEVLPDMIVGHEAPEALPESDSAEQQAIRRGESLAQSARELRERISPAGRTHSYSVAAS